MNRDRLNRALGRLDSRTLPALNKNVVNAGWNPEPAVEPRRKGKTVKAYNDQK